MSTTRTITRSKVHLGASLPTPKVPIAGTGAKSRMQRMYASENVVRCHRCPPASFCDTCMGLNKARIMAGLIRPRHQGDHKNNVLYPIAMAKGRVPHPQSLGRPGKGGNVVRAYVRPLGGGWCEGIACLDGVDVYTRKIRGRDAAWAYAQASVEQIKEGLKFERARGC